MKESTLFPHMRLGELRMEHGTYRLAGHGGCQDAISRVALNQALRIDPNQDEKGRYLFHAGNDEVVGWMTAKSKPGRALGEGQVALHCTVNSVTLPQESAPGHLTVRVVTGRSDEHFEMPPAGEARVYHSGVVGESHCQSAIAMCRDGDLVRFEAEEDNPHDAEAVAVISASGARIGYLARTSWLRDAFLYERKSIEARISRIGQGGGGQLGVTLEVAIGGPFPLAAVQSPPPPSIEPQHPATVVKPEPSSRPTPVRQLDPVQLQNSEATPPSTRGKRMLVVTLAVAALAVALFAASRY